MRLNSGSARRVHSRAREHVSRIAVHPEFSNDLSSSVQSSRARWMPSSSARELRREPRATLALTSPATVFSQLEPTPPFFDTNIQSETTITATIVITAPAVSPRTSTIVLTLTAPLVDQPFPPVSTSTKSPSFGSRHLTSILLGSILGTTGLVALLLLLAFLVQRRRRRHLEARNQIIETAEIDHPPVKHEISPLSFAFSDFGKTTITALDRHSRALSQSLDLDLEGARPSLSVLGAFRPTRTIVAEDEAWTPRRSSSPYTFPQALAPRPLPQTMSTIATRSTAPTRSAGTSVKFYTPSSTSSESSSVNLDGLEEALDATPVPPLPFPALIPEPMRFGGEEMVRSDNLGVPAIISRWRITDTGTLTPESRGVDAGSAEELAALERSRWSADTPSIAISGSRRASGTGSRNESGGSAESAFAGSKRSRESRDGSGESEGSRLRPAPGMDEGDRRGSHGTFGGG